MSRRGITYLRRQDAAEGLACAHRIPDGTPREACGLTARWHVLLTTRPEPAAVLLCDTHMQILNINNPWWDRHGATTACAATGHTWHHGQPSHCTAPA